MTAATVRRVVAVVLSGTLVTACGSTVSPTPTPTPTAAPTASPTPSPSPEPPLFPLAVIAAFTDLRTAIDPDGLVESLGAGEVLVPCGLESLQMGDEALAVRDPAECLAPDAIVERVRGEAGTLGLVPAGLVTPAVKVLRLGDADLFGSPSRRGEPYPLVAVGTPFDPDLIDYDPTAVRTAVTPLNWCPDRGVAQQVAKVGKGWDWLLDGGTVRYTGTHRDTTFSGRDGRGWVVVDAVPTGDHGRVLALMQDADLTIVDVRCPMVEGYRPATGNSTVFSLDPELTGLLERAGADIVSIASNHIYDHGRSGLRQTIEFLDAAGLPHTGAGMDLDAALAPVTVDVRGLRFGFVAFDGTIGSPRAGATTPGTADLSAANLRAAITKAKAGADVVIALPVWNWPEYWANFTKASLQRRDQMFDLGVTAVLGDGTHWAGGLSLSPGPDGPQLAVSSHGNFLFDQAWSRQTQEGVIYELTFYGPRLVQVRLHPYFILSHAQPNLTDPETDGAFVLKQVFGESLFELP